MALAVKVTTDHKIIRQWAEQRGGEPASILDRETPHENAGVLRIRFADSAEEDRVKRISWSDFFTRFEQSHLAFLYEEENAEGDQSRFFKFISRNGE